MNPIVILLDSTCDMTPQLLKQFDIDYMHMGISVDDKELDASLSWDTFSMQEFYGWMKEGKRVFTVAVKEVDFENKFRELLSQGNDVLYIGCSSALSASVTIAANVAKRLAPEFPNNKVIVVDGLCSGMGQGMAGIYASELRAKGLSVEEIASTIEKEKLQYNQWGTVDDLNYLKRAGRVKASSAFFGNLFGVKPIIISDKIGANFAYKKVKGRQTSIQELADSVQRTFVDPNRYIAISHADCEADALKVKELIEKAGVPNKGIFVTPLGPILGASCGPKTIIAFNFGPEVTILGE